MGTVLVAEPSDDELLVRVRGGSADALEALYDRYQGTAMAIAYRMLGERGAAEEVVQEAFLSVWRRATTFEPSRGSAKTWLLSLVRNRTIDRLRRVRAAPAEADLEAAHDLADTRLLDTFDAAYQALVGERLRRAVALLPREQRQIIELAYFSGRTQQQISTEIGLPLGTVKSRTRLALVRLKHALDRELKGEE